MVHKSIVIVGGGPVGLTLALRLARQGRAVTVLDQGLDKQADGRVLALSYASQTILAELSAWPATQASPIDCVQISHQGLGISQITATGLKLAHLGFTVRYADLCRQLLEQVHLQPLITSLTATVTAVHDGAGYAAVSYLAAGQEEWLSCELLILAEGGQLLAQQPKQIDHDYQQQALVVPIRTAELATTIAHERFGSQGPLVLLPYQDYYVAVWSLPNQLAAELKDDSGRLLSMLDQAYTRRLGGAQLAGKVTSFPLRLRQVKQRLGQRLVLIGNSAQIVHPVSAQGLNLGLRDVRLLADLLKEPSVTLNQAVASYDRQRQRDVAAVVSFTHFLATQMEKDGPLLKHLRGAGLIALSNLPPVQNWLARSLIFGI